MNILYIGQYPLGSTSRMRGEILKNLYPQANYHVINTSIPFDGANRLLRSLCFRYKIGPLIDKINKYILKEVTNLTAETQRRRKERGEINKISNGYTLIWVDKGVFITPKTTQYLKSLTNKLVHFTPDPAFTFHKSHLFRASLPLYDYAITTKAYELDYFRQYLSEDHIIYATQGFDKTIHLPKTPFQNKKEGVLFIGHYEKARGQAVQQMIDAGIMVYLAGIKWDAFVNNNKTNIFLNYLGQGIYGDAYVEALSSYHFSWGSISKWIPELHTTRTFEIPACGTALLTERNSETNLFFKDDEVLFYDSMDELIEKIRYYQNHLDELEILTKKGTERVNRDGRDYESILRLVLKKIKL